MVPNGIVWVRLILLATKVEELIFKNRDDDADDHDTDLYEKDFSKDKEFRKKRILDTGEHVRLAEIKWKQCLEVIRADLSKNSDFTNRLLVTLLINYAVILLAILVIAL